MRHADYLMDLLRPLRVYRLDGGPGAGELLGEGAALDGCGGELARVAREMSLATAEDAGLEAIESLLSRRPVAATPERRRAALAALLRVGGDSFTLEAVNDNLTGCGLNTAVSETVRPGYVEVRFPDVPGIPDGFEGMRRIIEDILPCHLGIEYIFWFITWAMMEEKFHTWGETETGGHTWEELEKMVR